MARPDWRRRYELEHWAENHIFMPNVELPDDWPERRSLPSADIEPLSCGDHASGLTGVYAVVNGLKLLLAQVAPLQSADERLLLELAWSFIGRRAIIAPHIGLRQHTFTRVADALSFGLSRRRGDWVRCEAFQTAPGSQSNIAEMLERLVVARHVVLILLGRGHYTVLRGYTPLSWLLFDATGRRWMLRKAAGRIPVFKPIMSFSRAR